MVVIIMMFMMIKIWIKFIEVKWWDIVKFGDEMLCSEMMKIGGVNDV